MNFASSVISVVVGFTAISAAVTVYAAGEFSAVTEDVVVTSRRKDELKQEVPLSVTAWGADAIEQIKPTTLRDFDSLAPNVYIGMNPEGPAASKIFIRGVGYAGIEKSQGPQVGLFVDGIQMGSSTGQLVDTFDVETVEINRGPQGVRFGSNNNGGNIVVNRVQPKFNEFGISASIETGNFDSESYKARFNVPLVEEKLALKIGAISRERDGFYDNVNIGGTAGDIDFQALTTALRWAPESDFEATLTYDRIDDTSQSSPKDPRYNGNNVHQTEADKRESASYHVDQVGLRASWNFGHGLKLHSVTGWHKSEDKADHDFDGGGQSTTGVPWVQLHFLRDQNFEVLTQEFRLHGAFSNDLDYLVGFYYSETDLVSEQKSNTQGQSFIAPGFSNFRPDCSLSGIRANVSDIFTCQRTNRMSTENSFSESESYAFFGSLTWRPSEKMELMIGMRHIDEETMAGSTYRDRSTGEYDDRPRDQEFDFSGFPSVLDYTFENEHSWTDTIWTASAKYALTASHLVYGNYSEGLRSGGFSIRSGRSLPGVPSDAPFDPEEVRQIEIGSKNEFLHGALQLNLAYFKLTQTNTQFDVNFLTFPGTSGIIVNGGDVVHDGWELEGRWLINDSFKLTFSYGTTDTRNETFSLPCDRDNSCTELLFRPSFYTHRRGGNSDSAQPKETYALGLSYMNVIGKGTFFGNIGYKHTGEFLLVNTGTHPAQRMYEDAYQLWDARIGYDLPLESDAVLSLTLFGKNLTDEEYREQSILFGLQSGAEFIGDGSVSSGVQGWGAPRTYAVEIRYSM